MIWYQFLAITATVGLFVLLAVVIGGWLVFKAKTITMPTPFIKMPHKKEAPMSYAPQADEIPDIFNEELLPDVARLRNQRMEEPGQNPIKRVLREVSGKS